jgi:hypothetical protein
VGVLVQLRAALGFGKMSRTKRRTAQFHSPAQVASRQAGDGGGELDGEVAQGSVLVRRQRGWRRGRELAGD